jgi:hypothetical protein
MVRAWHGRGMANMNQTRPHCVNQMGKTHSKTLAARHGRGTAWARHAMCKSALMQPSQPLGGWWGWRSARNWQLENSWKSVQQIWFIKMCRNFPYIFNTRKLQRTLWHLERFWKSIQAEKNFANKSRRDPKHISSVQNDFFTNVTVHEKIVQNGASVPGLSRYTYIS